MTISLSKSLPEITLDTRVKQAAGPVVTPMDESVAMFSQESQAYFTLEDVAKDIWNRIEAPILVGELCQDLLKVYEDIGEAACHKQVIEFLTELQDNGLVEVVF